MPADPPDRHSARFTAALPWRYLHHCAAGSIPSAWRPWLEDRGSLTRRLLLASDGDLRVRILRQEPGTVAQDEARALGLRPRCRALIREVVLLGRGMPWVYARSILPLSTLTGRLRRLRHLDNRPLGQVLFNDRSMTRDAVQVTRLSAAALPPRIDLPRGVPTAPLWGRRSVFRLDGKPLLVAEFFLPDFDPYNAGR